MRNSYYTIWIQNCTSCNSFSNISFLNIIYCLIHKRCRYPHKKKSIEDKSEERIELINMYL